MEDLIQILFILFFIITSIASSISKKKKKRRQQAKTVPAPQQVETEATPKKEKSTAEILEEILGLKMEQPEPQHREVPNYKTKQYPVHDDSETWDPVAEYEEPTDKKVNRNSYQDSIKRKKTEIIQDKKKHQAFQDQPILVKKVIKPNKFAELLSDKDNLKNFIIIQEVLNKPKALRR